MKKIMLLTVVALLAAVPAMAAIKDSRHNLGAGSAYAYKVGGMSEICIFCHAPHNPAQKTPLWNRTAPATTTFSFYNNTSVNMTQAAGTAFSTNSVSKMCLSCHDGATGLWAGVENKFNKTVSSGGTRVLAGWAAIGGNGGAGNLTDDHPVNLIYNTSQDGDFNDVATAQGGGAKFFYDSTVGATTPLVECASCHDPHKTIYGKFLRTSNTTSRLCLACHQK